MTEPGQFFVLRTGERTGNRHWDGPFITWDRADSAREQLFDRDRAFIAVAVPEPESELGRILAAKRPEVYAALGIELEPRIVFSKFPSCPDCGIPEELHGDNCGPPPIEVRQS